MATSLTTIKKQTRDCQLNVFYPIAPLLFTAPFSAEVRQPFLADPSGKEEQSGWKA
jgi:hypothetical protein